MPELPKDPDALEKWRNLPQNKPSRQALPPIMGGSRLLWGFVALLALIIIISLLAQPV